jgi:quercetin dioxygenase-like cupin family protein
MVNNWIPMAEGVRRRILADGEQLMLVEVHFEAGAIGAVHSHPHEQITYIVSGRVRFTRDDTSHDLNAGDSIHIPGGISHGVLALEESTLLDTFSPPREDFRT